MAYLTFIAFFGLLPLREREDINAFIQFYRLQVEIDSLTVPQNLILFWSYSTSQPEGNRRPKVKS